MVYSSWEERTQREKRTKREKSTDGACNSRPSNNAVCVRTHSSKDNNNKKEMKRKRKKDHTGTIHSRYVMMMNDACRLNSQIFFDLYDRSSFAQ